ncbi:hypothetical protein L596_015770 [Steinernema carpocapsae]|uniref:PHD-type domain-containing protein n=1 Tax=Steinernema carpocapsae TaxID=34508 RepID=A0A4U5NH76_STECR|nr:hypothetical protein L596_015770 [Steinernema carpocapsae]
MSEETDGDLPKAEAAPAQAVPAEIAAPDAPEAVATDAEATNDSLATSATTELPSEPADGSSSPKDELETEEGTEAADDIEDEDVDEEEEDDEQEDEDEDEENEDEGDEDTLGEEEPAKVIPPVDPEQLFSSPVYAQICSFFTRFCVTLGMKPVDFDRVERMFCVFDGGKVNRDLIELHITLLRKMNVKGARMDKWEMFLRKFCTMIPALEDETRQLERLGYIELPLETKLTILNTLCCTQFDKNIKLRENIFNTYNAFELRMLPIGCDKNGLNYYYQQDHSLNVRVYTEEPDDNSGGTWKIVVRSMPELKRLINALKRSDFGIVEEDNGDEAVKKENPEDEPTGSSLDEEIPMPAIAEGSDLKSAFAKSCKRGMFVDLFQEDSVLNRKKNERLQKKQLKQEKATSIEPKHGTLEPMEEEEEDEIKKEIKTEDEENEKEATPKESTPVLDEELLQELEESDRRILPRRSARSSALKVLTSSARKPPRKPAETKKEVQESEGEEDNDDEFEDDGSDDLRSSDDEFMPKSAKRALRKRKARNTNGQATPKKVPRKKKQAMVFEESDESDEEQEQKERKKATDKSLCLKCKKANKPEVLLLCDMCDDACHTFCLRPPLWYVLRRLVLS